MKNEQSHTDGDECTAAFGLDARAHVDLREPDYVAAGSPAARGLDL